MGSAIAYVTALNGFEVVVRTRRGMNLLYDIVEKAKKKKFLTFKNGYLGRKSGKGFYNY